MGEVEIAGGDFMEHGREEDEVLAAYQCDFDIGARGDSFVEFESRVDSSGAPAENHDARFRSAWHVTPLTELRHQTACSRARLGKMLNPRGSFSEPRP